MRLNYKKLGDFIELIERRNTNLEYGIDDVMGINNTKELMETKARSEYADLTKFYILEPGEFIYNPRTSRNGEKVGMAYNKDPIDTASYVVLTETESGFTLEEVLVKYDRERMEYSILNSGSPDNRIYKYVNFSPKSRI